MEGNCQLDPAGCAPTGWPLIRVVAILVLLGSFSVAGAAQSPEQDTDRIAPVKQLFAEQRWQEIVRSVQSVTKPSAELDYYYGIALARIGNWDGAYQAFTAGHRLQPGDERFPVELAGVAFKERRFSEATKWLHYALRLDPSDAYANNFLASIYFLDGNSEAAVKYWNRLGKPEIATISMQPEPHLRAALLDTAFAISPASMLRLSDLWMTQERISGLETFPSYTFDLIPREDGRFDMVFRGNERNGWGANKWQDVFSFFRGAFQQTVYPEYFNLNHSAINIVSMVRWDAQKRRFMGSLSGPLKRNARQRYTLGLDLRNENWDIRPSFTGPAPLFGALNLRREAVTAGIRSFAGARWNWSTGVELSYRDFRSVFAGSALTPGLLSEGPQLKHLAQFDYDLLRIPERRLITRVSISSQAGRIWSQASHSFAKLQGSLATHWFPQSQGDDYEVDERFQVGGTFGQVPFDELFMLGIDQDNDLWLRGHIGTRDGRKGAAPIGRNYMLSNWTLNKNAYTNGLLNLKLGPFIDTGTIRDPSPSLGARNWLVDTGVQAKVRLLGVGVTVSYGRDLRAGNNAVYATVGR